MCGIKWCNVEDRYWKNGNPKSLCSVHIQYREYCQGASASTEIHKMYKVEKFVKGRGQCESCGFDPIVSYPNLPTLAQTSMLDVDHIDSNKKHFKEHENPSNYQLLCKHCHIEKGHIAGDNIRKDLRK